MLLLLLTSFLRKNVVPRNPPVVMVFDYISTIIKSFLIGDTCYHLEITLRDFFTRIHLDNPNLVDVLENLDIDFEQICYKKYTNTTYIPFEDFSEYLSDDEWDNIIDIDSIEEID